MAQIALDVPASIVEALPDDDAAADMHQAVAGWESKINALLEEDTAGIVDIIERFEDRWEQYDAFVVELRAWGQSPIFAMAWRDLHESLIHQLLAHDELADAIDRERHARIVEDGIRLGE